MSESENDTPEASYEQDADAKRRIHVLVYASDWDWLGRTYSDSVKRSNVIRRLLRDYRKRIEAKAEQQL